MEEQEELRATRRHRAFGIQCHDGHPYRTTDTLGLYLRDFREYYQKYVVVDFQSRPPA